MYSNLLLSIHTVFRSFVEAFNVPFSSSLGMLNTDLNRSSIVLSSRFQ